MTLFKLKYCFFKNCKVVVFIFFMIPVLTNSQDLSFSQFYANKVNLNPAFTGSLKSKRIGMMYRDQWLGISEAYRSFLVSYDARLNRSRSGLGLVFFNDKAGSGSYNTTQIGITYSYHLKVSMFESIRIGTGLSYNQASIDPNNFLFADQIVSGASISQDLLAQSANYFNSKFGFLYSKEDNWWLGISANNLNEPNNSFLGNNSVLDKRYSVHIGKTEILKRSVNSVRTNQITYALHYQIEAKWDALDLGFYYKTGVLTMGSWYKGLPFLKRNAGDYVNHNALVLLLGLEMAHFQFGYSWDFTISKLQQSKGTQEISLAFEIGKSTRTMRPSFIPCPKF